MPAATPASNANDVRLSELMAALSMATDLGMGQPLAFALSGCQLAVRLGEKLGLGEAELRDVYYQALLRYIGCNAETHVLAAVVGDEIALRSEVVGLDTPGPGVVAMVARFIRQAHAGASPLRMAQALARGLLAMSAAETEFYAGHCEVAQRLGQRLGFGESLVRALGQLYARWDGKGVPALKGDAIAPAVLIVTLAQDMITFQRLGGLEAALKTARQRQGRAYAPWVVEAFCRHAPELLQGLEAEPSWSDISALEPGPHTYLTDAQYEIACQAMADFTDLKSPYTLGHSHQVAALAAGAAARCGLPAGDVSLARRAGLLHDLGRVGVSAGIWTAPGPLSESQWERVRLYPYYTERILARPAALARLGAVAGLHRERLDGSGYHRGATAAALPILARVLAAADVYQALLEARPHRPARTLDEAAHVLQQEARAGRLDLEAVQAVLAEAGRPHAQAGGAYVAGLSPREVEVLRLIARGHTIKQAAQALVVAPKTIDNHIQHIYAKIGVTTRAGAALFAIEQNLLDEPPK
jgi:HD-GYP domain-containing protein (c-di-GMP phosphodiesterase class II)